MSSSSFNSNKKNCLRLNISGCITLASVQSIMSKKISELEDLVSNIEISSTPQSIDVKIDLSKVTKVDMSALALVLEIEKKIASLTRKNLIYLNLVWLNTPSNLISLADLCGLGQNLEFK